MGARFRISLVLALATTSLVAALPARAAFDNDTVTVVTTATVAPAMTVTPDGTVHVVTSSGGQQTHYWREGATWQSEAIAITSGGGNAAFVDLQYGPGGHLALLRRGGSGHLIVHRRGPSSWDADTIPAPVTPPQGPSYSLAVDPITDEPVAAWVTLSGGLYRLWMARRTNGGWSVVQVDSSTMIMSQPAIALAPSGQIRLAQNREEGPGGGAHGLYYGEAETEQGPFTWSNADTASYPESINLFNVSLALDPVSSEPRIAYRATFYSLSYASRSAGGWATQSLDEGAALYYPPSLALDALGRPRILVTRFFNVLESPVFRAEQECGGIVSKHPLLLERDDPTGTGPFTATLNVRGRETFGHALATIGTRTVWTWRDSDGSNCLPAAIEVLENVPAASVDPEHPRRTLLQLAPNPIRSGGVLNLRLSSGREAAITLRIEDVAGRRVASRDHSAAPGENAIAWTLPALRAGWYRVTARQGGATLGSASFLVID